MLVIKRFILLVCALIISLVFLEFVSQLFFPVSNDFWRHDKDLGYSLIPGKEGRYISQDFDINVKINSQGFRDVERDFYNKDSFRILVVGDSFVEALQVPLENSFSQLLGNKLSYLGKYEVVSMGVSGYGTLQELIMFNKSGVEYSPDLVVLMFLPLNDPYDNSVYLEQDTKVPFYVNSTIIYPKQPGKIKTFFKYIYGKSNLFRSLVLLQRKLLSGSSSMNGTNTPPVFYGVYSNNYTKEWGDAWNVTELLLSKFNDAVNSSGSKLVVFIVPAKEQVYSFSDNTFDVYNYNLSRPTDITLNICNKLGIICYDMRKVFFDSSISNETYYKHDGHWNILGNSLAADFIYEKLINDKLID
ncbi:hypothetical protein J4230_01510 [Candidatus Woesearchaeota archaeon]|nr:hypothetical protein [Candidatus Woesearchaeota archaeon]